MSLPKINIKQGGDEIQEMYTRYIRTFTLEITDDDNCTHGLKVTVPFVIFSSDQSQAFNPELISNDGEEVGINLHPETWVFVKNEIVSRMMANGFDQNRYLQR